MEGQNGSQRRRNQTEVPAGLCGDILRKLVARMMVKQMAARVEAKQRLFDTH